MKRSEVGERQTRFDVAVTEYLGAARRASNNDPISGHFLPKRSVSELRRDQARWHLEAVQAGVHLIMAAHVTGKPDTSTENLFEELGRRTMLTDSVLSPLKDALVFLTAARVAGKID